MNYVDILTPLATPLSILFVGLIIWNQLRKDMQPIFVGLISGLAVQAKSNPMFWFLIMLYFFASTLQALGDEARTLGWLITAAICKSVQPGIVAVIALLNKAPSPSVPAIPPAETEKLPTS